MANEETVALMNKYVEMKAEVTRLGSEKQRLLDEAMPKEVRERVAEIEAEFDGKSEAAETALAELEETIKAGVVAARSSLAVEGMKAAFHAGRVTWDAKGLDAAMQSSPQVADAIAQYKKQGKDYASFTFDK
jgi:hypothetical protein